MVVEIMLARGGDVSMDAIATALERPPGSDPARVARPATPIEVSFQSQSSFFADESQKRKECLRGLAVVLLWLGSVNCVASVRGGVLWKLRISDAEQVTYNMNMGLPRRR